MKAVFLELINERLVQVDQREIPDHHGVYWKTAVMEPIKAFVDHSEDTMPNRPFNKEKIYRMVQPPSGKFPAIFILENIL